MIKCSILNDVYSTNIFKIYLVTCRILELDIDDRLATGYIILVNDIATVMETSNPRIYWYTIKTRNSELLANCKQLKMTASDGKTYDTDCLSIKGLDVLPRKRREVF